MKLRAFRHWLSVLLTAAAVYVLGAYFIVPVIWSHFEHQPGLATRAAGTTTRQGILGDPLNVGLAGSRDDVVRAMHMAGWFPADAVTFRSSLAIVGSVVLDHPYLDAPVSTLLYESRKQDLAFEKPAGKSANRRHHVRFWKVLDGGVEGYPVWLGAATFDRGVGFSHYTGQVTHHIDADIDAERDLLIADLTNTHAVTTLYQVSGVGPTINARNGGGDVYYTDGVKAGAIMPH